MTYKKCLLYFKNYDKNIKNLILNILRWLEIHKIEAEILEIPAPALKFLSNDALIICLGGDGTLLGAGRMAAGKNIPIMGINCGHVGFLCVANPENWESMLFRILSGAEAATYHIGLQWRLREGDSVMATGVAINDLVISRGSLTRMITLDVKISGREYGPLRGDGLICYTPLGSTGYNLSAGGPILAPEMKNIGLTPICPFTFSFSPVVTAEKALIEISAMSNRSPVYATMDGQEGFEIKEEQSLEINAFKDAICLPGLHHDNPGGYFRNK